MILHLSGDEARKCIDRVGRNSVNEPEDILVEIRIVIVE